MHKITAKEFTLEDFSTEQLTCDAFSLEAIINDLNIFRERYINYDLLPQKVKDEFSRKDYWWNIIQLLPSSYNQTRNVMMNYEVLANIYKSRRGHKLDEWRDFCKWIEELPYSELITGGTDEKMAYEVLTNIYKSYRGHKLGEWREFCKWIEELPYSELIAGGTDEKMA